MVRWPLPLVPMPEHHAMSGPASEHGKGSPARPPSSYVVNGPPTPDPLVAQVIREIAERWQRGERPAVEEFLARYPELARRPEAAIDLIYEEVCLRQDAGEEVDEEEVYRRFPQWRAPLEVLLHCDRILTSSSAAPQ